jgi:hypothetical protein
MNKNNLVLRVKIIMKLRINLFVILIFNTNQKLLHVKFSVITCWSYEKFEN